MSALYDRMVAAEDCQEFAHDHAGMEVQGNTMADDAFLLCMQECAKEIRAAMA